MIEFMRALATSASGMQAQAERLRLVSENIANADTAGYRRKLAPFRTVLDEDTGAAQVRLGQVSLDQSELRSAYEPSNPLADPTTGRVLYSNVNIITEVADAREAQRSFEANLNMFDQARRMYGNVLDLLRR